MQSKVTYCSSLYMSHARQVQQASWLNVLANRDSTH